jgi:hypothetical protein
MSTLPDLANWANLTIEERQLLVTADREAHPYNAPDSQAKFTARATACRAILQPYVESLGQFEVLKAHNHQMRDSTDKWTHERIVSSVVYGLCGLLWVYEAPVVHHLIERHKAGEALELLRGDILRCWACGQASELTRLQGNTLTPLRYDHSKPLSNFDHIELSDCPIDPALPYSAEIDVPSGKMVMANHLSPLFKEIEDPHSEENNICYVWGRKNCTLEYAKQGYIEMNIGNCSCVMYQTNEAGTKFIIGESGCVRGRKEIASVCTDFRGYGIADLHLAMKNGLAAMQTDRPHMSFDIIACKPGRYRFTHRYHLCRDDKREIFTHVEWIGPCSTVTPT